MKDVPLGPSPEESAVLQEYGLAKRQSGWYGNGESDMIVRSFRFNDATGAYGAFTYFRQPGMHPETIGHDGASSADRYLFWTGTTLVDATFTVPTPNAKPALAALAGFFPQVGGAAGTPPTLPHYLPTAQLDPATIHYVIGPAAFAQLHSQIPAATIDFGLDAELITAQYGSEGTLTLLLYPTPQIAGAHLKALDTLAQSSGFSTRRSGPIVAIVSGASSPQNAQRLLTAVHYADYVTINHPEGYVPETVKLYRLLVGITMIVVYLTCAALLLGFFLGGGRALVRTLRGKPASTVSEEEFISLHLS